MQLLNFDIDAIVDETIAKQIKYNEHNESVFPDSKLGRSALIGLRGGRSIGYAPRKLLDWRPLESRWYQLSTIALAVGDAYWKMLQELSETCRRVGGDGTVWIPQQNKEYVDVFNGESLGNNTFKRLFDKAISKPDLKPLIASNDEQNILHRLQERRDTSYRRADVYRRAWYYVIENRLEKYLRQVASRSYTAKLNAYEPCSFLFENEGRSYMVTSDQYLRLTWNTGNLYVCHQRGTQLGTS